MHRSILTCQTFCPVHCYDDQCVTLFVGNKGFASMQYLVDELTLNKTSALIGMKWILTNLNTSDWPLYLCS